MGVLEASTSREQLEESGLLEFWGRRAPAKGLLRTATRHRRACGVRNRALIALLYRAGLRIGEALNDDVGFP